MSKHEHIQPAELLESEPFGFTQVVASAPGRTVFVSGQVALDKQLQLVGDDLAGQTAQALANLGHALAAAGAQPSDVTMVRAYIVDFQPADGSTLGPEFRRFFGSPPPASTWVGVTGLAVPNCRIEIEAYAVVGG